MQLIDFLVLLIDRTKIYLAGPRFKGDRSTAVCVRFVIITIIAVGVLKCYFLIYTLTEN